LFSGFLAYTLNPSYGAEISTIGFGVTSCPFAKDSTERKGTKSLIKTERKIMFVFC
jgi:hypothetical protein